MGSMFGKLLKRRLKARPPGSDEFYQRGLTAAAQGDLPAAVSFFDEVIAANPTHADALYKRGNALKDLGKLDAAVGSYDRAIEARSDFTYAYCNRGVLQHRLGRLEQALASYDRAVQLDSKDALTHYNRALLLQDLSQWEGALASYDLAIEANPNYSEARYNRAMAQLFLGRYQEGWQGYELRWQHAQRLSLGKVRNFSAPLWLGREDITGKRLLLHAEGGLGDTIQFCRYTALCAARGAIVYLEVQPPLVALLSDLPGVASVFAAGDPLPEFDYHTPLMSLPLAFDTTPETVPSSHGYLEADPALVELWQHRLGSSATPRIGLTWSGNPDNWIDARRTIALSELEPHLPRGLRYISLQRDVRPRDKAYLESAPLIEVLDKSLLDFSNTAALSKCLDVCITVDTSPAHLCGALGNETWLMLAHTPDWRWIRGRKNTPWYASMRLFQQSQPEAWTEVFASVAEGLRQRFPQAE